MKSKEKDIAKTICNEIFSSIGKLLVKGAEEAFVSGEYEIYKSGKQAGLYEAKKAVKGVLEGYLREESIKKVYGSDLKVEGSEIEKEKLYSELVTIGRDFGAIAPKPFVDWLKENCYYSKDGAVFVQKHITSLIVYVIFYKKNFSVLACYEGWLVFDSGLKNTTLTDFKKIIEEAENCTPPTNGEK